MNSRAPQKSKRDEAVSAAAGGVAHDLNNLFTAVISCLELALSSPELAPGLTEDLVNAKVSARRGAELVGRLLAFCRAPAPRLTSLHLQLVLEEVSAMFKRHLPEGISLALAGSENLLSEICADDWHLKQILLNLCFSARDAIGLNGTICLQATVAPDPRASAHTASGKTCVLLSVSDTGGPWAAEMLELVDDPLRWSKTFLKGPGLGLLIANCLARELGGWLEGGGSMGEGNQVRLFLPDSSPGPVPAIPHPVEEEIPLDGSETILLFEPEQAIRTIARSVLEYRGYQIIEVAALEEEAIEGITPRGVDLFLLDAEVSLQSPDGLAVLQRKWPDAKVIWLGRLAEKKKGEQSWEQLSDGRALARMVRQTLGPRKTV